MLYACKDMINYGIKNSKSMYTILLAEDDPDVQFLYASKLRLSGYVVMTAHNGYEALNLLDKVTCDLALVDIRMPEMDGEELISRLRQHKNQSLLPVIILTNISKSEAPLGLRYMNINSYVLKVHTTPSQLVKLIDDFFKSS